MLAFNCAVGVYFEMLSSAAIALTMSVLFRLVTSTGPS